MGNRAWGTGWAGGLRGLVTLDKGPRETRDLKRQRVRVQAPTDPDPQALPLPFPFLCLPHGSALLGHLRAQADLVRKVAPGGTRLRASLLGKQRAAVSLPVVPAGPSGSYQS